MNYLKGCLSAIAIILSVHASAYDFQSNGIYYNILTGTKNVEVTYDILENASYSGVIDLPTTVNNEGTEYTVTAIGNKAFYKSKITTIHIPEGITKIGEFAFYFSENLKNVTLPQSLTTMSQYALSGTAIPSIAIPSGIKSIEKGEFQACEQLHTVFMSPNVTTIGSYGFYANHALKEIYIPTDHMINATAFAVFQGLTAFDIIVPENKVSDFATTAPWSSFSVYPPEEFSLSMVIKGVRHEGFDEIELDEDKAFKIYDGDQLIAITSAPTYRLPNTVKKTYKLVPTDYFYDASPLYYTTSTAGVGNITTDNDMLSITGNILQASGSMIGKNVDIYTLDGKKVTTFIASSATDLGKLTAGAYIISCNGTTLKFIRN